MNMDQAATWLAGSILLMLGFIVIIIGVLVINNLFHRFWKPVSWVKYDFQPVYYDSTTGEQIIKEPTLKEEAKDERIMGRKVSS